MYRLYHDFAERYDLHTPPSHYQHDHAFVLEQARRLSPTCRLLDVGCGTGVLLEKALTAGLDAYGVDSSQDMVEVARRRVGVERIRVQRMQEISEVSAYDLVCLVSWPIHYCESEEELSDVIRRCRRSLRPGGVLLLQVANEDQMDGSVKIDFEPGPGGESKDTLFIHRFRALRDAQHRVTAEYVYVSRTHRELLCEQHALRFANPSLIAAVSQSAGFARVDVVKPDSVSPFVVAKRENDASPVRRTKGGRDG